MATARSGHGSANRLADRDLSAPYLRNLLGAVSARLRDVGFGSASLWFVGLYPNEVETLAGVRRCSSPSPTTPEPGPWPADNSIIHQKLRYVAIDQLSYAKR